MYLSQFAPPAALFLLKINPFDFFFEIHGRITPLRVSFMTIKMESTPCSWLLLLGLLLTTASAEAKHILDITHLIHDNMPVFGSAKGAGSLIVENNRTLVVTGTIKLGAHYGTHVDSPEHMKQLINLGVDATSLDLQTLIGPVLVVRVPDEVNITGEALMSLHIPEGVERVIFKTKNTDRGLMYQTAFASDYTAFTPDGAKWLVENTKIKFIGIDYMSVSVIDYIVPVHVTLLNNTGIIPVECLNLDRVKPGQYDVYCLPLKVKAEASPVRCILVK